ncbi:MAG: AAA family ATPase [Pseudomonadota bacterium]
MYNAFFGFKEDPFNLTPDPRYLFLSAYHKEALDHLLYGINDRKGFIAITGGIGTGKTTLCRALLSHLDGTTKNALIFNSFISDMELLETINQEFGIGPQTKAETKKAYIDALNGFLLENFSQGGNAILLIDEAQNLSRAVLEQIRMLSNLETEKEKLIQIVLVGQSELKEVLTAPSLRQLNERITVRYDLKPLVAKDIKGYVEHRLVVAGGRGNPRFTGGALKEIYAYSRGNPRRVNAVCDRALLIAYAKETYTISRGMVRRAIKEILGTTAAGHSGKDWSRKRIVSSTMLLLLLIMAAGFGGWMYREAISEVLFRGQKADVIEMAKAEMFKAKIIKVKKVASEAPEPEKKDADLFLDEKASLAGLLDLYRRDMKDYDQNMDEGYFSLVSFNIGPEYYVIFKRPFRVRLTDSGQTPLSTGRYLLIRDVTEEGAVAVDAGGKERAVSRNFILSHWDRKVSWVYPYDYQGMNLVKGTNDSEVLKVQRILNEIGYLLTPTGLYDESTFREVMKFQMDFGLKADGIVGPRTRALLFLMSK